MKYIYIIITLFLFSSCLSSDHWEIKEIKFLNGKKVYLKSHSWAIPERNSIILSNHDKKEFNDKTDIDFGSFIDLIYEIKNDSLYIYQSESQKKYRTNINSVTFNNTKVKFVNTNHYLKFLDSLSKFPSDEIKN